MVLFRSKKQPKSIYFYQTGSGSKFNRAARVGSGQTISGTGRVRASVLSPCRPLLVGNRDVTGGARQTGGNFPFYMVFIW